MEKKVEKNGKNGRIKNKNKYFLIKINMNNFLSFLFAFLLFVLITRSVSAYIDPGTGSFLFQIMIGAVLGGVFTIKMYYRKIKKFCTNSFSGKNKKNEQK